MFFFLFMLPADASHFTSVGPEIELGMGGTWIYPIHTNDGWMIAMGQQGDLLAAPLTEGWTVEMEEVMYLSNHGELKDHALRICPDGSYLHAANETVESSNFIYRYDEELSLLGSGEIPQTEPSHAANDVAAICGQTFMGIGIAEAQGTRDFFWSIDEEGEPLERTELEASPRLTGAGMLEEDSTLFVVGRDFMPELVVAAYDSDFGLQDTWLIPAESEGILHYWPSRLMRVGDLYLLVTMGRDPQYSWLFDTGDLYIAVLDLDFVPLEWVQLSQNIPEEGGGMRPWMERHDEQLVVAYDKMNSLHLYVIELDLHSFGIVEDEEYESPAVEYPEEKEGCMNRSILLPFFVFPFLYARKRQENSHKYLQPFGSYTSQENQCH
jgi:hypothetical protein